MHGHKFTLKSNVFDLRILFQWILPFSNNLKFKYYNVLLPSTLLGFFAIAATVHELT